MVRDGPDGALWVADMYRLVIEHPEWIPKEWQARLDLRAGHDKGRIYRIYPQGHRPRPIPRIDRLDAVGRARPLDRSSGTLRELVQQRLVRAGRTRAAVEPLKSLLTRPRSGPQGQLQAREALDGACIGGQGHAARGGSGDAHPAVRRRRECGTEADPSHRQGAELRASRVERSLASANGDRALVRGGGLQERPIRSASGTGTRESRPAAGGLGRLRHFGQASPQDYDRRTVSRLVDGPRQLAEA